jgi:vacuolar-type H+-ATPase subunit E/Vma4
VIATLPAGSVAALEPVQSKLHAQAEAEAHTRLDQARDQAGRIRTEARARAAGILADSRAEGEEQARAAVAARVVRRRREARDVVLSVRRDLYDELRRASRDAARALRDSPDYPQILRLLTERAVAAMGADVAVQESPDGGVVAVAGSRRLDLSLPVLAEREVDRLGSEVERLWAA